MSKKSLIILLSVSLFINIFAISTFGFYFLKHYNYHRIIKHKQGFRKNTFKRSILAHKLHLNESQLKTIDAINDSSRNKIRSMIIELKDNKSELLLLLKENNPDRDKINNLIRKTAYIQTVIDSQIYENMYKIKQVLTPQQKKIFFKLMEREKSFRKSRP
jgi:Spy/CpxP family protein refolding chaperone